MILGTDNEGRDITYDEATSTFAIAGIATTPDRILAYDRGGQMNWASDEMRLWVAKTDEHWRRAAARPAPAPAARQTSPSRVETQPSATRATNYEPENIISLAGRLKSLATAIIVTFTIVGALQGLVAGAAATAANFSFGLLLFPLLFGGAGYLGGYLVTLAIKVAADLLLAVVQIEFNTRRA
jgi:hypothetical protein